MGRGPTLRESVRSWNFRDLPSLKLTGSHLKGCHSKRKRSYSNNPFWGAILVSEIYNTGWNAHAEVITSQLERMQRRRISAGDVDMRVCVCIAFFSGWSIEQIQVHFQSERRQIPPAEVRKIIESIVPNGRGYVSSHAWGYPKYRYTVVESRYPFSNHQIWVPAKIFKVYLSDLSKSRPTYHDQNNKREFFRLNVPNSSLGILVVICPDKMVLVLVGA